MDGGGVVEEKKQGFYHPEVKAMKTEDFVKGYIMYKLVTDNNKNTCGGGNRNNGGGCLTAIIVVVVVLLLMGFIGSCSGNKNRSSYSSTYSSYTSAKKYCMAAGCTNARLSGGYYYYDHTCKKSGCYNQKTSGSDYCSKHKPAANTGSQNRTTTKATTKGAEKKTKSDPYNAASYYDYEDFYYDWYDDFDGIDEAEDYWDEWH